MAVIRRDTGVRERAVGSRGLLVDVIRRSDAIRSGERSGRPCEALEEGRQEGEKEARKPISGIRREGCGSSIGESGAAFSATYSNRADIQKTKGTRGDRGSEILKKNEIPREEEGDNDERRH